MTAAIAFILGLSLGICYSFLKLRQYRQTLKPIGELIFANSDSLTLLPLTEQVNRSFILLNQKSQQLEEQLQIWQESLGLAPIGYLLLDEENQLLWCNEYARSLLQIGDRWDGKIRLLLELVRSYELDRLIEEARQIQQPQVREWVFYPTNYQVARTNPATRASIPIKGYSFPLSQRRVSVFLENQESLVKLSRSRERTFSDLTHELRTPLTGIALVAETLQKKLADRERKLVERVLKEIDRLMNLIQDWLEISQIQENPLNSLNYNTVELRELIFSVWEILEAIAAKKQVDLDYFGPDKLELQADRARLTQVFLNLFDNALKHSNLGDKIMVRVKVISQESLHNEIGDVFEYVEIDIIDSGSGFKVAELPYIFDRLYRGDPSRAIARSDANNGEEIQAMTSGNGLGLAITREIILAHQGKIEALNHPETGGAWLKIILPVNNYTRASIVL